MWENMFVLVQTPTNETKLQFDYLFVVVDHIIIRNGRFTPITHNTHTIWPVLFDFLNSDMVTGMITFKPKLYKSLLLTQFSLLLNKAPAAPVSLCQALFVK